MSARIKLAEAMGWKHIHKKYVKMDGQSYPFGCPPAKEYSDGKINKKYQEQIPDPENKANDCEALIRHLQANGWRVVIHHREKSGATIRVILPRQLQFHDWSGDNWKTGVCELACKALSIGDSG